MTSSNYVIEARHLTKSYGKNQVLKGIDLQVERGTMLALLGPNGAGKTTIVRILSTLLGFDGGTVRVDGHDVRTEADKVRAVIGLTGQAAAVDELLTGRENLIMMGRLYRLTGASAKARAQQLLEEFDLVEAAGRPAKTYSGGMRRRLDLAVSLIATPPVLFLDEPTTGLDPRSRLGMWEKSKVGNDRLELTFRDAESFQRAVAELGDDIIDADPKEFSAIVIIKDTNSDVKRALDVLAAAGIAVQSLAVHKPTLDDVFLSLTGKQKLAEAVGVK